MRFYIRCDSLETGAEGGFKTFTAGSVHHYIDGVEVTAREFWAAWRAVHTED